MKKFYLSICLIFASFITVGQTGMWTWMKGDSIVNPSGNFSSQGNSSPTNTPSGLYEAIEWTDLNGNFWLFGGYDNGVHDDLWKFDPVINEWTWVKGSAGVFQSPVLGTQGVPSVSNTPGNQQWCSASWTDLQGNLWFFGGSDGGGSAYNLLWKYVISSNEWTWMKGSGFINDQGNYGIQGIPSASNNPSSRWETNGSWTDSNGNLWLYGGLTNSARDDLWKYDMATNNWTWIKGSNTVGQAPNYGTKGLPDSANTPGARQVYAKWRHQNDLWLYGGYVSGGASNDLWKYDILTNTWTWMSGTNTPNDPGLYTTYCQSDSTYISSGGFENRGSWLGDDGAFYVYGGIGNNDFKEDLWKYCPSNNTWIWVKGSATINSSPVYGTIGLPAGTNSPGARMGSLGWKDNSGNLWLFGGWDNGYDLKNDLWKFTPDTSCENCNTIVSLLPQVNLSSSDTTFCDKKCLDFTDLSTNNPTSWQWSFPGALPSSTTLQNPTNICYNAYGTFDVTLIACNSSGCDTLLLPSFITEYQVPPQPVITQGHDTLYSSPGYTYAWYNNSNPGVIISTNSYYVTSIGGSYFVIISDSIGCQSSSAIFVATGTGELNTGEQIAITPNPAYDVVNIIINNTGNFSHIELKVLNMLGQELFHSVLDKQPYSIDLSSMVNGIYTLELKMADGMVNKKIIVFH